MAGGDPEACARCADASPVAGPGGHWCRALARPAPGNGCRLFLDRDRDRCPARCVMPDGNGTLCLETGALLPAGPCRDCGHRGDAARWRPAP